METENKLSFGEERIGTFNPNGILEVNRIKGLYAEILDVLYSLELSQKVGPSEKLRLIKVAMTETEGACLWAVKAITKEE